MNLNNIELELTSLLRACQANPSLLISALAIACVITFIIAIVSDNLMVKRKLNQPRKGSERRGFSALRSQAAQDSN